MFRVLDLQDEEIFDSVFEGVNSIVFIFSANHRHVATLQGCFLLVYFITNVQLFVVTRLNFSSS